MSERERKPKRRGRRPGVVYDEYIKSAAWRKKREEYFASKMPKVCAVCGRGDALNIHHKTYDRLGQEYLSDLVALCQTCHFSAHEFARVTGNKLFRASDRLARIRERHGAGPKGWIRPAHWDDMSHLIDARPRMFASGRKRKCGKCGRRIRFGYVESGLGVRIAFDPKPPHQNHLLTCPNNDKPVKSKQRHPKRKRNRKAKAKKERQRELDNLIREQAKEMTNTAPLPGELGDRELPPPYAES